ncbi:MAG: hypothetical protein WB711_21075 [Terriglobales bacterium]
MKRGTNTIKVNIRLIAAAIEQTEKRPSAKVRFGEDLHCCLNSVRV